MTLPWPPPPGATPVHGWGVITLQPERKYAEVIRVPAGMSLALGSLTFSDITTPEPNHAAAIQLETAAPSHDGQPGGAMSQFDQVQVPSGTSVHLAFPVPLVLTGPRDREWVCRGLLIAHSPGLRAAEIWVFGVGYRF